jgi:hypothetical protein
MMLVTGVCPHNLIANQFLHADIVWTLVECHHA